MRLIDADALMTWFNDHYDDEEVTVGFVSGLIKDAPTIEPERKKGKWMLSDDKFWCICPFCGAEIDVSMGLGIIVDYEEVSSMNFCPNCGADMRGEQDETD